MNPFSNVVDVEKRPRQDLLPILKVGYSDPYYQEQFKGLRAKLESKVDADGIKVVAVTSSIAGEGKTISVANLAVNIASAGRKKVLLIDADLRKTDLSRGLEISRVAGLGEYLAGAASIGDIVRTNILPGLDVISGGKTVSDPSTVLGGDKFRSFLERVRDHFDVILVDTPPVLPVSDTLSLRDVVDAFILLFRIQATPYTMLKQALDELGNLKILGVILNGIEPKSQKYYQKYYGKYYHKKDIFENKTP